MDAETRRYCQIRKTALLAERALYEPDMRTAAEYVDPYAGRYLTRRTTTNEQALPSRAKIINSAATKALRTMDAGFMGGHTSKSRAWFLLGVNDPVLRDQEDVKVWLDDLTQSMRDVLARSNFYTALPSLYHSRHLFGIGAMMAEDDDENVLRFHARNIGTYAAALDHRGRTDTFYYFYRDSAKNIRKDFESAVGFQGLPQRVQDAINNNKLDEKFIVEALIEPNPDAKPGSKVKSERAYRHLYWIEGSLGDTHGCLDCDGYYEMPVFTPRWGADGNDTYGPSPTLDAIGDIKQLQYLEGQKLLLIDLMADPALKLPEIMRNKSSSMRPGARVYVTPDQAQQTVEPLYTPDPRGLQAVQADIDKVKARVDEAYYADLFRMLDFLDDRQRTAYEISERKEEKVAMLGPALESLTDELLDLVIELLYAHMLRRGMIKPPPAALNGIPLKVEYTSILAQAQKAAGTGTVERVLGIVASIAQAKADMSVFDKINTDETIEIVHDMQGAPARMLNSDDQVAGIRQARQQQQQAAQMAQLAPALKQGMDAAKAGAQAVPQDGSILKNLAEQAA